jgi:putative Mg2+ transporter-C (MgtC) family protein
VLSGNEQIMLRLGAAMMLGGTLGLNRELHGKAAGLRTHALVSLGTAVVIMAALGFQDRAGRANPAEVGRVVQGILTGIGFFGAGVILHDPAGHVSGLTTAATIWTSAVLGIVCGLGCWTVLLIALVLTAAVLLFGRPIERLAERLFKRYQTRAPEN